jgi:hypothetical protein
METDCNLRVGCNMALPTLPILLDVEFTFNAQLLTADAGGLLPRPKILTFPVLSESSSTPRGENSGLANFSSPRIFSNSRPFVVELSRVTAWESSVKLPSEQARSRLLKAIRYRQLLCKPYSGCLEEDGFTLSLGSLLSCCPRSVMSYIISWYI